MIQITFKPKQMELIVEGHADYAKKGKDIVCSAVSILFYTLGESLMHSTSMLYEEPIVKDEEGNGYICCHPKEEYEGNIARTYWTILNGLQLLADGYPKHVSLEIEG